MRQRFAKNAYGGFFRPRAAVVAALALLLTPLPALAQVTEPGCAPDVYDSLQKTGQAHATYAKSVIDQIALKDDSVLATSCFNKAAGFAAQQAGALFSGDFSMELAPVIQDALAGILGNFSDSLGGIMNTVDYGISGMQLPTLNISQFGLDTPDIADDVLSVLPVDPNTITFDCDTPAKLWRTVNTKGINTQMDYISVWDLDTSGGPQGEPFSGVLPVVSERSGESFITNWNAQAAQDAFLDMNIALSNLPAPVVPPYSGTTGGAPCQVLIAAGVLEAGATCP